MAEPVQAVVLAVLIMATSVWLGGYVAIGVVARAAAQTLEPAQRVTFFRSLGRSYLWVGVSALVVSYVAGAVLIRDHSWDGLMISNVVLAALLIVGLAVAVRQARRMTRLRHAMIEDPSLRAQVDRQARAATGLRASLGLITLALVVLGAFLAS